MSFPRWKKVAALALAALCSAANFALAVSLYHLWRSSKREAQQLAARQALQAIHDDESILKDKE